MNPPDHSPPILLPSTGYKRLDAYILANLIQLATLAFCRRHLTRDLDPCGRQFDQMAQAARSGVKNITEGCERLATSSQTALKLLDVAKASLCELRDDLLTFLLDRSAVPWSNASPEARAVFAVRLDPAAFDASDANRGLALHILAQRAKFASFFPPADPEASANALLVLLTRALATLDRLLRRVADDFTRNGGATERMTAARVAYRRTRAAPVPDDAPSCPLCHAPMRLRHGPYGDFWGCTAHPSCKGKRPP